MVVQFFPKPAVLLATLPVLLLAELMVVLYVTIFRLIGYKSWEWLANEVKVERGCVARCVHWLKVIVVPLSISPTSTFSYLLPGGVRNAAHTSPC
uniref:Uncharacterized protein n=2 Tax=Oryza TaxID=4527 RepID=A0A0D3H850_9ORYZ